MNGQWTGPVPPQCDLCRTSIPEAGEFADASIRGRWAILCPACADRLPIKYGTGRGQRYRHQDNTWIKTRG